MDDAKILRDLFDGTGVMSALDHSKIEGANNPEMLNIDAQAARIARKAAEALRRSRQVCQVLAQSPHQDPGIAMELSPTLVNCECYSGHHGPTGHSIQGSWMEGCNSDTEFLGQERLVKH